MVEMAGNEFTLKANLVLLAIDFTNPVDGLLDAFSVTKGVRNSTRVAIEGDNAYVTNMSEVFAAGDVRHGQSFAM